MSDEAVKDIRALAKLIGAVNGFVILVALYATGMAGLFSENQDAWSKEPWFWFMVFGSTFLAYSIAR
jgi:cytochrome b